MSNMGFRGVTPFKDALDRPTPSGLNRPTPFVLTQYLRRLHQLRNVQVTTAAMIPAVVKEVTPLLLNFNALIQSQPV